MARKKKWTKKDGSESFSWEAIWRDPDGKQRRKAGFKRKVDAEAYEREQQVDIQRGDWTDPRRGRMTYEEWARLWWQGYAPSLTESTRIEYERILHAQLIPAFGSHPLARIGHEDIQRWVSQQEAAPATVKKRYDLLQRSMRAAETARRISHSPCVDIRLPKGHARRVERALKPDQVKALVEAAPECYQAMLLLAAYGGLRLGELAGLRADAVNLVRGTVRVTEVMGWQRGTPVPRPRPKSDAGRRDVGLPSRVVQPLEHHLTEFGPTREGFVFGSPGGGRLRKDNFRRRVFAPARDAAGLDPSVRFHDLRHTAASLMIRAGLDVVTVSRRLGHRKASYTMDLYGHWFPDEDATHREAMDRLIEMESLSSEDNVVPLAS